MCYCAIKNQAMSEALRVLDEVRLNFSPQGLFTLNITLAFIMFGVALEIKVEHFKNIWKNKRLPVIGFISQFLILPFVTFLIIVALNQFITPTLAMGMILVASCPGGNISNFISSLAKGNTALSVTLTAISTISAIALTPFNFLFWGGLYTNVVSHIDSQTLLRPLEIQPIYIFETVFILLGIPLILGMAFNHFLPRITAKIVKPIKVISIIFFSAIVIIAFHHNYDHFMHFIKYIFFLVLIHNAIGLLAGYSFAGFTHCGETDRRTITIETGIQNSGLALVLLFNPRIFPPGLANGGMAFIAAWWGIWHILSGLLIAWYWSRRKPAT